jgi:TIR domain-containing protein
MVDSGLRLIKAPRAFISYAREDEAAARRLYIGLKAAGVEAWLDKESILPGQDWQEAIAAAIESSEYFVAVLSSHSLNKRGFVQRELRIALEVLDEVPEGQVFEDAACGL